MVHTADLYHLSESSSFFHEAHEQWDEGDSSELMD